MSGFFCETPKIILIVVVSYMTGKDRIGAGLDDMDAVYSAGTVVPISNEYYEGYHPKHLTQITNKNSLYKTFKVSSKHGHYINYGLRAYTRQLIEMAEQKASSRVFMTTIRLSDELSSHLFDIDKRPSTGKKSETPICVLRRLLKTHLLDPHEVEHYYFVVEKSRNGRLHVHIVSLHEVPEASDPGLVDVFSSPTMKRFEATARKLPFIESDRSGVNIVDTYKPTLFRKHIGDDNADLLELEIELLDDSGWKPRRVVMVKPGVEEVHSFVAVNPVPINTGLADYLSKELQKPLFTKSRYNFSISSALRATAKPNIDVVIAANKVRKNAKRKLGL